MLSSDAFLPPSLREEQQTVEEPWGPGDGAAVIGPAHLPGWEEASEEVLGEARAARLPTGASAYLPVARRAHQQWGVAAIDVLPARYPAAPTALGLVAGQARLAAYPPASWPEAR